MDQNKMKKIAPIIIAIVAVGAISFYGGMKYAERNFSVRGGQNLSPDTRQQRFNQMSGNGSRTRNGQAGANFASGEILSKDDKSITIKLIDGGSKIIFFSDKTNILKTTAGGQNDVAVGENVTINGSANSDGSITAQSIQIRPKPQGM